MTSIKESSSIETKNTPESKAIDFSERHVQQLLDENKIFATHWAVKTFVQILNPDLKELNYNFYSDEKCILDRLQYNWNNGQKKFRRFLDRFPIPLFDFGSLSFSQILDIIIIKCFTFDIIGKTNEIPVTDIDILDRFNGTIKSRFLTGYYTSIKNDYAKGNLVHICKDTNILQYVKSSWKNKDYKISENIFHRISCLVENFIEYFNMGVDHNIYELENMVDMFFPGDSKTPKENIKVDTVNAIFKQLEIEIKDCSEKNIPMFLILKAIHKNTFCRGISSYSKHCSQYCYKYSLGYVLGCFCRYACIGTINTDDIFNEERNRIEIVYYHTTKLITCPYDSKEHFYKDWNAAYPSNLMLFAEWWHKGKCSYKLPKYLSGKFFLKFE